MVNFKTSSGVGWLTSPFRKESFSHIEQWFAVNLPDGQTATRDGSNSNCLPAAKQSESIGQFYAKSGKWKLVFSHKKLASKESTSTPATTQVRNSLGWWNWTILHPMGQNFVDVTVLHFERTITNHKEIGLGHLLPSWLQDDVFTLPS